MTPASRILALKAYRLTLKNITGKELAKRLGVDSADLAGMHAIRGRMIVAAEGQRLTENEHLVMKTLARLEARRVALGHGTVTTPRVDRAAGKRSGWCAYTVDKRLRMARLPEEEEEDASYRFLGLVRHSTNGHIWLTLRGWAFVWEARLIKPNWKVPS
jgi:hypothetical protein